MNNFTTCEQRLILEALEWCKERSTIGHKFTLLLICETADQAADLYTKHAVDRSLFINKIRQLSERKAFKIIQQGAK